MQTETAFAGPTLRITASQHAEIVNHCLAGVPEEACGLISGPMVQIGGPGVLEPTGSVTEVHLCDNEAKSAVLYTLAPRDLLNATRAAQAAGNEIIGVFHSHTHTEAYPSPTDVAQAADPAWIYVLVSLKYDEPIMRAYRIRGAVIEEVEIEIELADRP